MSEVIGIPPWLVNDPRCVLYLRGEGPDGSTRIRDWSSSHKTVTANGNACNSTTQTKFPPASIYFGGNGDYLSITPATDLNFLHQVGTTGKWSIDFLYYCSDNTRSDTFVDTAAIDSKNSGFSLYMGNYNHIQSYISYGSSGNYICLLSQVPFSRTNGHWYYIHESYDQSLSADNMTLDIHDLTAGSSVVSATATKTGNTPSTADNVHAYIGRFDAAYPIYDLKGNIDEFTVFRDVIIPISKRYPQYRRLVV